MYKDEGLPGEDYAREMLTAVRRKLGLAKQCREAGQSLFHFCSARRHGSVLQISVFAASVQRGGRVSPPQKLKFERLTLAAVSAQFYAAQAGTLRQPATERPRDGCFGRFDQLFRFGNLSCPPGGRLDAPLFEKFQKI